MARKKMKKLTDNQIQKLLKVAGESRAKAYAPYSKFKVGAALLTESGKVFGGCNVENTSYGLTICAERNAFANAVLNGRKKFKALLIFSGTEENAAPCGACRQVITEFAPDDFLIILANKNHELEFFTLSELFPKPFKFNK